LGGLEISDLNQYDYVEGVGLVQVTHGEWVRFEDADNRIRELEVDVARLKTDKADWVLYSESVAEVCTEEIFAEIEIEFNLRQSIAMKEPEQ
jgi:hypothetical protein